MQTLVVWSCGHVSLCFSYSTWYPNSTVRKEAGDHAMLPSAREVLCHKCFQLQQWMSSILVLLVLARNLEISAVKLFMPSAVLSHRQPYCCEPNSKAQGDEAETPSQTRDPLLKVVWGCLSKCGGGTSVFWFQMLHCYFLSLVKADSFLP